MVNWNYVYLVGANAAKVGSLVRAAAPTSNNYAAVQVSTATDQTGLIGYSMVASSTGSLIPVAMSGFSLALTTGTVNPGDTLVSTSAAAGYMATNANSQFDADFAAALSTGVASGGLTLVRMR